MFIYSFIYEMNNSHEAFTLFLDKQKDIYLDLKAVSIKCHIKQITPFTKSHLEKG